MNGPVVWCEIPVQNLTRAIKFYSAVFKVKINRNKEFGYDQGVFTRKDDGHGIRGSLFRTPTDKPTRQGARLYFAVEGRLDAACKAVVKHKGKILKPKHTMGKHGFRVMVLDCEGNRIVLHSHK